MRKSFVFIFVFTLLAACNSSSSTRVVYVDLQEVFEQFELKKELATKLDNELSMRKTTIDSLEYSLQAKQKGFKGTEQAFYTQNRSTVEMYGYLKNKYEKEAANLTQTYDDQIWKRINQYIKQYGEAHKIDLMLGKKNEGNLLYGKEGINQTEKVIQYINQKYKGE